jgi:hypothetical protein
MLASFSLRRRTEDEVETRDKHLPMAGKKLKK